MEPKKKAGRYLQEFIQNDLLEKMVFLGGPRQVGKTTLAIQQLVNGSKQHPAYLNWDFPKSKSSLTQGDLPAREPLVIIDEIHKYKHWRNLVKGLYDHYGDQQKILVTGSARLDYYRMGGDSLQGRYHYYRLHPFTLAEFDPQFARASTELLLRFGGFPQPLFKQSQVYWQRWQKERVTRVIREDLRDLEQVREISQLELF
jgi:predicted AAA+ superfamily ATPase